MSREWIPADAVVMARLGAERRGVLVEDGRDGEPSAEEALRVVLGVASFVVGNGSDEPTQLVSASLAVLRRALQEPA